MPHLTQNAYHYLKKNAAKLILGGGKKKTTKHTHTHKRKQKTRKLTRPSKPWKAQGY